MGDDLGARADGATVLLTTQYLEEADRLAHDIAVIDRGRSSRPARRTTQGRGRAAGARGRPRPTGPTISGVAAVLSARLSGDPRDQRRVGAEDRPGEDGRRMPEIVRELDQAGIEVAEFHAPQGKPRRRCLTLTGHTAEDDHATTAAGKAARRQRANRVPDERSCRLRRQPAGTRDRPAELVHARLAERAQDQDEPEDLFGLSLQPIMYLVLFTYVFGGSIAGGTHQYLQFSLPASWCSPWCSPRSAPA